MTCSKGPQAGTQTQGNCSKDKAFVHRMPALPTELNGTPVCFFLMQSDSIALVWYFSAFKFKQCFCNSSSVEPCSVMLKCSDNHAHSVSRLKAELSGM